MVCFHHAFEGCPGGAGRAGACSRGLRPRVFLFCAVGRCFGRRRQSVFTSPLMRPIIWFRGGGMSDGVSFRKAAAEGASLRLDRHVQTDFAGGNIGLAVCCFFCWFVAAAGGRTRRQPVLFCFVPGPLVCVRPGEQSGRLCSWPGSGRCAWSPKSNFVCILSALSQPNSYRDRPILSHGSINGPVEFIRQCRISRNRSQTKHPTRSEPVMNSSAACCCKRNSLHTVSRLGNSRTKCCCKRNSLHAVS